MNQYWQRRHMAVAEAEEEDRIYWEERRRYEEDYLDWCRRGALGPFPPGRGRPPFPAGGPPPVRKICIYIIQKQVKILKLE